MVGLWPARFSYSSRDAPPRQPDVSGDRQKTTLRHGSIGASIAFLLTGLAVGMWLVVSQRQISAIRQQLSPGGGDSDHDLALCGIDTSDNAAQRFFMVDLPVFDAWDARNMTYTDGKLLEMGWNIVVGQGGRLLHGWLLCAHVIPDVFTRLLERASLPYGALVNLFFSGCSLSSVWSLCCLLTRWRNLPTALMVLFALVYVLMYPVVWDAATGYFQPSRPVYKMPDGSYVEDTSIHVYPCWTVNDPRLPVTQRIIASRPTAFRDFSGHIHELSEGQDPLLADYLPYVNAQYRLRLASLARCGDLDDMDLAILTSFSGNQLSVDFPDYSANHQVHSVYELDSTVAPPLPKLPSCGFASQATINQTCSLDQPGCIQGQPRSDHGWNPRGSRTSHIVNVTMNSSIDTSTLSYGSLPYNSTLWINGTNIDLAAPTLNLTEGCYSGATWSCTCYDNIPITYNYRDPDNMQCITSSGYTWGFATGVVIFALSLEIAWIIGCYGIWLDAQLNSYLIKHGRRAGGDFRNILDFAASMNQDLGPGTDELTNEELRKRLGRCGNVGHDINGRLVNENGSVGILTARNIPPPRKRVSRLLRSREKVNVQVWDDEKSVQSMSTLSQSSSLERAA